MIMSEEYRKRIADFILGFIDIADCKRGYSDDDVIRQSIKALISNEIFTVASLQEEMLRRNAVFVSKEFIIACVVD